MNSIVEQEESKRGDDVSENNFMQVELANNSPDEHIVPEQPQQADGQTREEVTLFETNEQIR